MKNAKRIEPILIFASERSGSNMIRNHIGSHVSVSSPASPQFIQLLKGRLKIDYSQPNQVITLLNHMRDLCNSTYCNWDLDVNTNEIYDELKPTNLFSCIHALYSALCYQENTTRYVSKEIENVLFSQHLKLMGIEHKIVYLYRHPSDILNSWKSNKISIYDSKYRVREFCKEHYNMIEHILINATYSIKLKYDDFTQNTESESQSLFTFLNLDKSKMNSTSLGKTHSNPLWDNSTKAIFQNNKKYRGSIRLKQIRKFIESEAESIIVFNNDRLREVDSRRRGLNTLFVHLVFALERINFILFHRNYYRKNFKNHIAHVRMNNQYIEEQMTK